MNLSNLIPNPTPIPTDEEIYAELNALFKKRGGVRHTDFFETEHSKKSNAIELSKRVLSPMELQKLDLDGLTVEKGEFVDAEDFFALRADLIYSIPYKNTSDLMQLYLLFEHKSRSSRTAVLQMFLYNVQIYLTKYKEHLHKKGKKGKFYLPEIVPVLYYCGAKPFSSPLTMDHLFPDGNKSNLHFQVRIRDLSTLPDEEFEIKPNAVEFGLVENLMRDMWRPTTEQRLDDIQKHLTELARDRANYHFLNYAMGYMGSCRNNSVCLKYTEMFKDVYQNGGIDMHNKTVLEKIEEAKIWEAQEKGLEQGRKEGRKEGLEQGLEQGRKEGIGQGIGQGVGLRNVTSLLAVMKVHFGSIPEFVKERIQNLRGDIVWDSLIELAMTSETMEQFVAQLP